jgi:hypothetical protein
VTKLLKLIGVLCLLGLYEWTCVYSPSYTAVPTVLAVEKSGFDTVRLDGVAWFQCPVGSSGWYWHAKDVLGYEVDGKACCSGIGDKCKVITYP